MTPRDDQSPEEPAEASDKAGEQTRRITRFAQYTAPVMLAMLTSAGQDAALAQTAR